MTDPRREVESALAFCRPDNREDWLRIGMAIKSALGDAGFDLWDSWSQAADNYRPAAARAVWRSLRPDGGVTASTLFFIARANGWRGVSTTQQVRPARAPVVAFPTAAEQERLRGERRALAASLWRESAPLAGTMGERYLCARGVPVPPVDGDLRFHPDARAFGLRGPALVGRISDATDARHGIGAHVTFLCEQDGKVTRTERRYVGGKSGGVVRLWPDEDVTLALGIGEGLETCLALHALARVPAWACMDSGNLAAFPVLSGIEALHVAVDRDASGTGQRATVSVAERWQQAGREVVAWGAYRIGCDLADALQEGAA